MRNHPLAARIGITGSIAMRWLGLGRLHFDRMPRCRQRALRAGAPHGTVPAGVKRYIFSPDVACAKELEALADPNEIPDPPYGDWGEMPDGIQYFEAPVGAAQKLLFVGIGQDEPLDVAGVAKVGAEVRV